MDPHKRGHSCISIFADDFRSESECHGGKKNTDLKHQTSDKQKFEKKQLPQTDELIDPVSLPSNLL